MDFLDDLKLLSDSEKVKYGLFIVIAILVLQQLFKNIENKISLLVQTCIVGALFYLFINSDIKKKKKQEAEFIKYDGQENQNQNQELPKSATTEFSDKMKKLLKKDRQAFKIYKDLLDLRIYNDISFDNSLTRYLDFLEIKELLLQSDSINTKGMYETLELKINLCLNELLSVSKNVGDEDSLRLQSGVRKLYRFLYAEHMLEIRVFLKKKWKENEITIHSYPYSLKMSEVQPSNLESKYYSENYSVY
jgi:hypothetical protein